MIRVLDVDDAEGFVKAAIRKAGIRYDQSTYEDLVATGYLILVELSHKYDPARESDGVARFYGYANYLLPIKIRDAWHNMMPEHIFRTQPDGRRRWEYLPGALSWDSIMEETNEDGTVSGRIELTMRVPGDFVQANPVARTATQGHRGGAAQ